MTQSTKQALWNAEQKIDLVMKELTNAQSFIALAKAADVSPNYNAIRELIIGRSVELAGKIKDCAATSEERAEHKALMRLMDGIAANEGRTEPLTKEDLAKMEFDHFMKVGGVLNDGENDERKDSPKADN